MSYCRMSNDPDDLSDAYIYKDIDGHYYCLGCKLKGGPPKFYKTKNPIKMLNHMVKHIKADHMIPHYALWRLHIEIGTLVLDPYYEFKHKEKD